MDGLLKSLLMCLLLAAPTTVLANEDEDSYRGFDSIVSDLESVAQEPVPVVMDDWEEVALHGGIGLVMQDYNLVKDGAYTADGTLKGFQAHFGINMFSREARVEGLFRNFASDSLDDVEGGQYSVNLKEFEFRGLYLPSLSDKTRLRLGAGLAARYMSINDEKATTPFYTLVGGFERKITQALSVGFDFTIRNAISSDTFDKSARDGSIKLNATF